MKKCLPPSVLTIALATTSLLAIEGDDETGNAGSEVGYAIGQLSPALLLQTPDFFPESHTTRIEESGDVFQHMRLDRLQEQSPAIYAHLFPDPLPIVDNNPSYRPGYLWHDSMCGPCSIADNLLYFDRNGYPNLLPGSPDFTPDPAQAAEERELLAVTKAASLLASPAYMDTHYDDGTSILPMLSGTIEYVRSRGYDIKHIKVRHMKPSLDDVETHEAGVPNADYFFRAIVEGKADGNVDSPLTGHGIPVDYRKCKPSLAFLKQAIMEDAIVVINWWSYEPYVDPGTIANTNDPILDPWASWNWRRSGGHWIAPVGFGKEDENDPPNPNLILFHDSAGSNFGGTSNTDGNYLSQNIKPVEWTKLENLPGNPELLKSGGGSWDKPGTPEDEAIYANGHWAFMHDSNTKIRLLCGILVLYLDDPADNHLPFQMEDFLGTNGRDLASWRAPQLRRKADGSMNYSYVVAPDILDQGLENFQHMIQTTTDGRRWENVTPQPHPDVPGCFEANFHSDRDGRTRLFRLSAQTAPISAPQ